MREHPSGTSVRGYAYDLAVDRRRLRARATFGPSACGTPGAVHPGVVDLFVDDAVGALFLIAKVGTGFTANLTVAHTGVVLPPGREARLSSQLEGIEQSRSNPLSRKVTFSADVVSTDGEGRVVVHATARLLFVSRMPKGLLPAVLGHLSSANLWLLFGIAGYVQINVLPALCCARRRTTRPPSAPHPGPQYVAARSTLADAHAREKAGGGEAAPLLGGLTSTSFHLADLSEPQDATRGGPLPAFERGDPLHLKSADHALASPSGALSWHPEGVLLGEVHVTRSLTGPGPHLVAPVYLGTQVCGHAGIVHGGILAAVLQDVASSLVWEAGGEAWALQRATVSVDYRLPVVSGRTYTVLADIVPTEDESLMRVKLSLQATGGSRRVHCESSLTVPRAGSGPSKLASFSSLAGSFPSDPALAR
jgi:acyl-coenzyme A thioesterase PaaI-like protein